MLMTTVISWNYFETVSGCFRAFPINYVTLNSTPGAGWGFRTEKKDFWAKSSVLVASRLSLSISWLEQSPICRIWTLKERVEPFVEGRFQIDLFWMWPPFPSSLGTRADRYIRRRWARSKQILYWQIEEKKWDQEQTQACFAILTNPFSGFIRQNGTWNQNRFRPNYWGGKLCRSK